MYDTMLSNSLWKSSKDAENIPKANRIVIQLKNAALLKGAAF
jgi:hypothetical protein